MEIAEYLYMDHARVNSYFEQVSSPVNYDKIPVWKVALGLAGPSVESTQQRSARPFTEHEKLSKLATALPRAGPESLFGLSTGQARRATISLEKDNLKGITFWICQHNRKAKHRLYLIESATVKDERMQLFSGFSAMRVLLPRYGEAVR
jgi:hypothetical protein